MSKVFLKMNIRILIQKKKYFFRFSKNEKKGESKKNNAILIFAAAVWPCCAMLGDHCGHCGHTVPEKSPTLWPLQVCGKFGRCLVAHTVTQATGGLV